MILIRSSLFNLLFFGTTFVLALVTTVVSWFAPDRVIRMATVWARLMLWAARVVCGIRWRVIGDVPAGPALIASHHESAFDTLVWLLLVPRPAYVMKRELLRIPLFGRLTVPAGMIAVDRAAGAKALRALLRDAAAAAAAERQIIIFPEGTRAEPGKLLPLQPGVAAIAAATGLPVVPVMTDSGTCWGRRAFRKRPGVIRILILPPIPPATPRQQIVPMLEIALRNGAASLAGSVDKPVSFR
jgi:1-acyl-sn-glycerol-3-phosphate acyltransferase